MKSSEVSLRERTSPHVDSIRKHRRIVMIGLVTILLGLVLMPISKFARTDNVSNSQTQTIAQSLCPPQIITSLDYGICHITIIEHTPNLTANAQITVYDENNSIVYQSSLFEEAPSIVKRTYNFTVINPGMYNITLENAGVYFVKAEMTTITWKNVTTYPFQSLFYSGLIIALAGWFVICIGLATDKRTKDESRQV